MNGKPQMSEDHVCEIIESSIPLPILVYSQDDTSDKPIEVIYVSEMDESESLGFPTGITLCKEDGAGRYYTAEYELVDAYIDYTQNNTNTEYDPLEN